MKAWKTSAARRLATLVIVAATMGATASAQAQWAVIDASNLAQAIVMVDQMKTQVDQMRQEYAAITGNRNLGQILNSPLLRNYLPEQWQSIYDQVKGGQLPGITNAALQILNAEGMTGGTAGQQRYNNTLAANKAMAMQAYQATLSRLNNIQALMKQANLTEDAAAKADLTNRIGAEQAMIQNEQTRLQLMANLQQVEEKLAERARSAEFRRNLMAH